VDYGTEDGADGMAVDVKGNIYLASRSLKRPGILVIDPRGREIAFIPTGPSQPGAKTPKGIPSNCCFGIGKESKVLYITVDLSLYRIPLKIGGWHIPWAKGN
jgi:gluconolactonase